MDLHQDEDDEDIGLNHCPKNPGNLQRDMNLPRRTNDDDRPSPLAGLRFLMNSGQTKHLNRSTVRQAHSAHRQLLGGQSKLNGCGGHGELIENSFG